MEPASIVAIIIAAIAAVSSFWSQKSAAKTAKAQAEATHRLEMEKEAYNRARLYDTETIKRQYNEISEYRETNKKMEEEIQKLRYRLGRLESILPLNIEDLLKEHLNDDEPR